MELVAPAQGVFSQVSQGVDIKPGDRWLLDFTFRLEGQCSGELGNRIAQLTFQSGPAVAPDYQLQLRVQQGTATLNALAFATNDEMIPGSSNPVPAIELSWREWHEGQIEFTLNQASPSAAAELDGTRWDFMLPPLPDPVGGYTEVLLGNWRELGDANATCTVWFDHVELRELP